MGLKRIKIAHIHVWDKKNKGDAGIVLAVQDLLAQYFKNMEIIDLPIETLKNFDSKKINKINSADLAIIGGGGIFYRYFTPFNKKVIDAIKTPVVIFGVGYIREAGAKKLTQEERGSIIYLAKKAKLISVRDYYTKRLLTKHGLNQNKINITGDPAILLREIKPRKNKIKLTSGVKIGLNLNYSGWLGFGKWENDILNAYRKVANYYIKRYRAKIYYLMHHPDEINILKKLRIANMAIINLPPRQQKYMYGQFDLIIGMMLHSCVMAFGAGTPEINVAYDLRNKNFAKFINCPELVVSLPELKSNRLLRTAKQVFKKQNLYRAKFKARAKKIQEKHQRFFKKTEKLLLRQSYEK